MRTLTSVTLSIFVVTLVRAQSGFDELPVNTAGVIGQNVTLNCTLSGDGENSLLWSNPNGDTIYEKGNGISEQFEGKFDVNERGRNYNLVMLNAAEDDYGRYECATYSSSAFAEVILLDPGLACTETTNNDDNDFGNVVEGEQINLTCQTTYYGLWGPTQNWTNSAGLEIPASNDSSRNTMVYTYTQKVTSADNGLQWIVDSFFPPPPDGVIPDNNTTPPTAYYSRSAPTWSEVYESTQILVSYIPEDSNGSSAAIIGGMLGAIIFLLLVIVFLIGAICFMRKRSKKPKEMTNTRQETEPNEYNEYMPPPNQATSVFHVDSGLAVIKPEVDQQYEDFGGSPAEYAQMYTTPIKPTNKNRKKKTKQNEYEGLHEESRSKENNQYDMLNSQTMYYNL